MWELSRDTLNNSLADHPEQRPNAKRYPSVTFTRVDRFREALRRAGIIDGTPGTATERSQWKRIKDDLIRRGHLRIEGDLCWRPTEGALQ